MGLYFDNKQIECSVDASLAKGDRCGEGLTAVERHHAQAASERQAVEETLGEVVGGGAWCFVDGAGADWTTHQPEECEKAEGGRRGGLDERFRKLIAFEEGTRSCFKCGFSQKLCGTGGGEHGRCQWPNVAAALLRGHPAEEAGCRNRKQSRVRRGDRGRTRVCEVAWVEAQAASLGGADEQCDRANDRIRGMENAGASRRRDGRRGRRRSRERGGYQRGEQRG